MGKEVKIGLGVITILLIVLGVVLAQRFTGGLPVAEVPGNKPAGGKKLSSGPAKPTLLETKAGKPQPPNSVAAESHSGWSVSNRRDHDESVPTASFMPKSPSGRASSSHPSAEDRYHAQYPPSSAQNDSLDERDRVPFNPYAQGPEAAVQSPADFAATHGDVPPYGQAQVQQNPLRRYGSYGETSAAARFSTAGQASRSAIPQPPSYQQLPITPAPAHAAAPPVAPVPEPSIPAEPIERRQNTGRYYVEPGDSFWKISEKLYGEGNYFKALEEHNRHRYPRPSALRVGDEIITPRLEVLQEKYPGLCPKERTANPGTPQTQAISNISLQATRDYLVEEGDTLFDIARYELGDGARWPEIYELNRQAIGEDIDFLRPGLTVRLPAAPNSTATPDPKDRLTQEPDTTLRR